jgi:hypothetical protein
MLLDEGVFYKFTIQIEITKFWSYIEVIYEEFY